jgi:hypothetical protein
LNKTHKEKYYNREKSCTETIRLTQLILDQYREIKKIRTEKSKRLILESDGNYVKIPRLLHACIKLNLTEKELIAMEFIVSTQVMPLPVSFSTLRWPEFNSVEYELCFLLIFLIEYMVDYFTLKSGFELCRFLNKRIHGIL